MAELADPLSLLRHYNVNKKEIVERDGQIIFGDLSWPKNVKTNYLRHIPRIGKKIRRKKKKGKNTFTRPTESGSDVIERVKEYYTLECLLFILKNIHVCHPDYCRAAAAANILAVRRPDRKKLLDYLNGKTATSDSIDKSGPLEIPIQVKREHEDEGVEPVAKKPYIEKTIKQEVREVKREHEDEGEEPEAKMPHIEKTIKQEVREVEVKHEDEGEEPSAKKPHIEKTIKQEVREVKSEHEDEAEESAAKTPHIEKPIKQEVQEVKREHEDEGEEPSAKKPYIEKTIKQEVQE